MPKRRATTKKRAASPTPPAAPKDDIKVGIPSGFVSKLYDMVNGAPEDIVAWLPEGDAFKISDLERLEGETLPTYFRHNRFPSLVRQLNFYSFRKVNKERNFWVYRHPEFHRDRPEELYLLKRRTTNNVDGRKHRPELDINSLEKGAAAMLDERGAPIKKARSASTKKKSTKRSNSNPVKEDKAPAPKKKRVSKTIRRVDNGEDSDSSGDEDPVVQPRSTKSSAPFGKVSSRRPAPRQVSITDMSTDTAPAKSDFLTPPRGNVLLEATDLHVVSDNSGFDTKEQSFLVAEVAQALEEHQKRAQTKSVASAARGKTVGRRNSGSTGVVTPIQLTDTMKYDGLTYDDDIVERDEDVMGIIDRSRAGFNAGNNKSGVVSDSDDSKDDAHLFKTSIVNPAAMTTTPTRGLGYKSNKQASKSYRSRAKSYDYTAIPVIDSTLVSMVGMKLVNGQNPLNEEVRDRALISRFCMSTAPQDPDIAGKIHALLSSTARGLGAEFTKYQNALHPNSATSCNTEFFDLSRTAFKAMHKSKIRDMVRDFSVFTINALEATLEDVNRGAYPGFSGNEKAALQTSIVLWRRFTGKGN